MPLVPEQVILSGIVESRARWDDMTPSLQYKTINHFADLAQEWLDNWNAKGRPGEGPPNQEYNHAPSKETRTP